MNTFIDPRDGARSHAAKGPARTTRAPEDLETLHRLCREGRLYEIEDWIRAGRPLQLAEPSADGRRRRASALEIALEHENHSLVLLLLCNGYDPSLEPVSPLDLALRARRPDLVALLLEWGADPHRVSRDDLFETYDSKLFERFYRLGVDLTEGHALAEALAYHTSNKPLFGFARRHREGDPKIQRELDIALGHHADRGNEKGVSLCLWAGADPHAPAPSLSYGRWHEDDDDEDDGGEHFIGFSAIYHACSSGHADILERLGPDPDRDDFDDLYCWARSGAVIEILTRHALPKEVGRVICAHLSRLRMSFDEWRWGSVYTLERLFEVGMRWETSSPEEIKAVRWHLLKTSDDTFVRIMKLLAGKDHCAPEILRELGRTSAIRRRMKEVGFIPPSPNDPDRHTRTRPTRSREVLRKFGVELPKPKKAQPQLSHVEYIGPWHRGGREIRLDRKALFERVWSTPVSKLAEEWGLSDRGLAKACQRLQIPVPPRGYWAKVHAGKRPRRARLPKLPAGQAEEIVIRMPE
ncbi:MAG TPA: hypothetical protein VF190_00980 [Rhodothermales bacterium]